MHKIHRGDDVIVIAGKDRGRRGTVLKVLNDKRVVVESINIAKKHVKANPNAGVSGGIIEREMPLDISNVMVYNPSTNKGDRIGFRVLKDNKKVRFFKSNGEVVDV